MDELQAKMIAERRDEHAQMVAKGQDLPPFDPEDPAGWKISEQAFRRKEVRRLAGLPDSSEPIPGWKWIPKDLIPVVDHLHALAGPEREPDPEPELEDEDAVAG